MWVPSGGEGLQPRAGLQPECALVGALAARVVPAGRESTDKVD